MAASKKKVVKIKIKKVRKEKSVTPGISNTVNVLLGNVAARRKRETNTKRTKYGNIQPGQGQSYGFRNTIDRSDPRQVPAFTRPIYYVPYNQGGEVIPRQNNNNPMIDDNRDKQLGSRNSLTTVPSAYINGSQRQIVDRNDNYDYFGGNRGGLQNAQVITYESENADNVEQQTEQTQSNRDGNTLYGDSSAENEAAVRGNSSPAESYRVSEPESDKLLQQVESVAKEEIAATPIRKSNPMNQQTESAGNTVGIPPSNKRTTPPPNPQSKLAGMNRNQSPPRQRKPNKLMNYSQKGGQTKL